MNMAQVGVLRHSIAVSKTLFAFAIGCAGIAVSAAIQAFVIEQWHIVLFGSRLAGMPYGAFALALIPAICFGFAAERIGVRPGWRAWLSCLLLLVGCILVFAPPALNAVLSGTGKPYLGSGNFPLGRWLECASMALILGAIAYTLGKENYCQPCQAYFRQAGARRYWFSSLADCVAFYDSIWRWDAGVDEIKSAVAQSRPRHLVHPGRAEAIILLSACPKCQQVNLTGSVLQKQGGDLKEIPGLARTRVLGHRSRERSIS